MAGPRWLTKAEVLAAHERQLAEHGGPPGIRDKGLLESALARPENLQAYGEPDIADLAAAYAFGLAKNHPFIDGNKRASLAACTTFLLMNGYRLPVDDPANIATWIDLAAGELSESDLAGWLRMRVVPLG